MIAASQGCAPLATQQLSAPEEFSATAGSQVTAEGEALNKEKALDKD